MHVEVLVAEIGSTTTVVSALRELDGSPRLLGQGVAPTSVLQGDVTVGLPGAVADLTRQLGATDLTWDRFLATSSAAGGLKMTVHGLVYDMTVRAAREAALGAGAVLRFATAGVLTDEDLEQVRQIRPNIILLAGGVDYGERTTVVANARRLAELAGRPGGWRAPVIYAGNVAVAPKAEAILREAGIDVRVVANVYPRIDELNIEPTRKAIQAAFEEHIVHAPGMEKVREMVDGSIMPTPGAVMEAARLLHDAIGPLVAFDVGGATTDVHSVAEASPDVEKALVAPEPFAKRTVEGDLGVFINAATVAERIGPDRLSAELGFDAAALLAAWPPIPDTEEERRLAARLAREAVTAALRRHAGRLRHLYGASGRRTIAEGKDLTPVRWVIGTGGPLTRLPEGAAILESVRAPEPGPDLLPPAGARVLIDRHYIMAACGVLATYHPQAALRLLKESLGL
jgi:uncharacterized protein (TIGR01319 family)